jgi:hypothetical protein
MAAYRTRGRTGANGQLQSFAEPEKRVSGRPVLIGKLPMADDSSIRLFSTTNLRPDVALAFFSSAVTPVLAALAARMRWRAFW